MAFFDEDPFEDILREFFGAPSLREEQFIGGEDEERNIDFIEDENKIYLIFELPGYNKEDISISVKGKELEIRAQKKENGVQSYLSQKLHQKLIIRKILPRFIKTKNFSYTMKNGVLEIIFDKTKKGRKNEFQI